MSILTADPRNFNLESPVNVIMHVYLEKFLWVHDRRPQNLEGGFKSLEKLHYISIYIYIVENQNEFIYKFK